MVSALSSHALGESCKRALQHECSHALSEAATLEGAVEGEHGQSAGEASSNTTQRVKSSEMFAEDDAALDDLLRELEDVEESDQSPQPHLEGYVPAPSLGASRTLMRSSNTVFVLSRVTLSRVTSGGSAAHRHLYGADQALLLLDRLPSSERLPQEVIDSVDCVLRREASGTQKTVPYREMRRILKMLKEEHLQEQRMAKSGCACFPIWFRKSQPVHPKPVVSHTPSANKTRHGDIVLKQLEDPEPERRPGPARSGSSSSPSGSSVSKPPVDREESLQLAKHAMQQSVKQMCDAGEDIAVTPLREILDKQATETHRAPATSGEVLQLLLKLKNEPDPRAKMQAVVLADAALTDSSRHSKALSASSRADRLVRGELRRSAHLQLLRPVTPEEGLCVCVGGCGGVRVFVCTCAAARLAGLSCSIENADT
jgi:hypothetical protein